MVKYFVILCLAAVASARPDVSQGYRYPTPGASGVGLLAPSSSGGSYAPSFSSSGSSFGPSFSSGSFSSGPSFSSGHSSFGSHGSSFGSGGFGSGSFGGGGGGGSAGYGGYSGYSGSGYSHYEDDTPIVTKNFYLHAAPEEQQDVVHKHFKIGRAQKHYRVLFIKAPSENGAAAHLSAEYAPQEEKTVIYVLSKKPDELQVSDIATPAPTEPSKPEVFFIKYKTEQEAAHATHTIQAQYDSLGGSSQVSDEGVSQVTSVIGSTGGDGGAAHHHHHVTSGSRVVPSGFKKTYLPPSK